MNDPFQELHKLTRCGFSMAWIGPCDAMATNGERCPKHTAMKCVSCGEPATRECDETGQFVCGAPLCEKCEHTTFEDGTNGGIGFNAGKPPEGMKAHCRKDAQRFTPWFARSENQ